MLFFFFFYTKAEAHSMAFNGMSRTSPERKKNSSEEEASAM